MNETLDITAFTAVRDQYAVELEKAQRELERATAKVEQAKTRLTVADDMIARATSGTDTQSSRSLAEAITKVVREHSDEVLIVKRISHFLHLAGVSAEMSAIHVNASRLVRRGVLETVLLADGGKAYRWKKPVSTQEEDNAL